MNLPETILKREGTRVPFDPAKIERAVLRCLRDGLGHTEVASGAVAADVTERVLNVLSYRQIQDPSVEDVQNLVIEQLWAAGYPQAATTYTMYREEHRKQRLQIDPAYQELVARNRQYFGAPEQELQFYDKYSRWRWEDGRRETWEEAVTRVISFLRQETVGDVLTPEEWQELHAAILKRDVLPSMRILQMAGPALERCHIGAYNCSYVPFDSIDSLVEDFYISMQGTGVGFSVEEDYAAEFPRVKKQRGRYQETLVVPDSTEGWCDSYKQYLQRLWEGEDPDVNVDFIRRAGSILKTKGGRASGPEPLLDLFQTARGIVLARQNRYLTPTDLLKIGCKQGEIVHVGGVRRAAKISLSDLSDQEIRNCKDGAFWDDPQRNMLGMSNNSAVYLDRPTSTQFMDEWLSLAKSNRGERGIFNRGAIYRQIPKRRRGHGMDPYRAPATLRFGTNPCQPAFATILTRKGIETFDDLEVGSEIWTGNTWSRVVRKLHTGDKAVYSFHTRAGSFIGTEDHQVLSEGTRVQAGSAETIDIAVGEGLYYSPEGPPPSQDVMDGLVLGDGMVHKASNNLMLLIVGEKDQEWLEGEVKTLFQKKRDRLNPRAWEIQTTLTPEELPKTYEREIPERFWYQASLEKMRGFLRGLYSANGSICGNRVTLKAASLKVILKTQEMLSALGIRSYYTTNRSAEVTFTNGTYRCRESYDLNISTDIHHFRYAIGFLQSDKMERLNQACQKAGDRIRNPKKSYEIVSREYLGVMPVYDITVEAEEHTYWTGGLLVSNCGEVLLRPFGLCNLSIAVARSGDTLEELHRKVRLATRLGTLQSMLTRFGYVREIWKKNAEEERLLGVDLMGALECEIISPRNPERAQVLAQLRDYAVQVNQEDAPRFGIGPSVAVTVNKPGGNSGEFLGIHSSGKPRWSRYAVRRFRIGAHTPVAKLLIEAGVPHFPENGQDPQNPSVWVFEFPQKAPEGSVLKEEMDVIAQLENWLCLKENWTEHNPSVTVYVKEDEWLKAGNWTYEHWDQVGGIAFLPSDGGTYRLAPYSEITPEEYEARVAALPTIDWSRLILFEREDMTTAAQELACTGDRCEL